MFCNECGKQIASGVLCDECKQKRKAAKKKPQTGSRYTQIEKPILALTISMVGIVLLFAANDLSYLGGRTAVVWFSLVGLILYGGIVGAEVYAVVLGIQSVFVFRSACAKREIKPVATLVLSCLSLFWTGCGLLMMMAMGSGFLGNLILI